MLARLYLIWSHKLYLMEVLRPEYKAIFFSPNYHKKYFLNFIWNSFKYVEFFLTVFIVSFFISFFWTEQTWKTEQTEVSLSDNGKVLQFSPHANSQIVSFLSVLLTWDVLITLLKVQIAELHFVFSQISLLEATYY